MVTIENHPIGPHFESTCLPWLQRFNELLRRQSAELSELGLTQRPLRVQGFQRLLSNA